MEDDLVSTEAQIQRIERILWGVYLIGIGAILLIPGQQAPDGTWLAVAGLILLGSNVVRYLSGIPLNRFTTAVGVLAMILGTSVMFGLGLPFFPLLLIIVGATIVFGAFNRNRALA